MDFGQIAQLGVLATAVGATAVLLGHKRHERRLRPVRIKKDVRR